MTGKSTTPGVIACYTSFSKYVGGKFIAAGLGAEFGPSQTPGIHFRVAVSDEYREAIIQGLTRGIADRFPHFLASGSVWVTRANEDPVNSSWNAFYRAAGMVVDAAYVLSLPAED